MTFLFTSNILTVKASKSEELIFGLEGHYCITLMNQKLPQKDS